jgi:hypothetical protein
MSNTNETVIYPAMESQGVSKIKNVLTNAEYDAELQSNPEPYKRNDFWTGTHIKYNAGEAKALIWSEGKKPKEIVLPLENGWYLPDENGIPNGEKSNSLNQNARYLWRYSRSNFEGLVVRWSDFDGYYWRGVGCICYGDSRCGVVAWKSGKEKTTENKDEKIKRLETENRELKEKLGKISKLAGV